MRAVSVVSYMPANGHKLSAVARRRLLQDGASARSTPSAPSPAPLEAPLDREALQRGSSSDVDIPPDDNGVETTNQFSKLVEASAVTFSPSREVEESTRGSIKIRLSHRQKFVVLGTCALWIKQGSVSIYGAVLNESTAIYRIYAPDTHALPAIEATSTYAELELESLNDGMNELPHIRSKELWAPAGVMSPVPSFYVMGHSFEQDLGATRHLRELDISRWKMLLKDLSSYGVADPPRILICGRRSSGLSTLARCVINRLLAKQLASLDSTTRPGVTVLDLETRMPEFVPPGLMTLVHVSKPVFGPPFTHLLPLSSSDCGQVLKQHFIGDISVTDVCDWHLTRLHDLLDLERSCRSEQAAAPVVIILPQWLNGLELDTASKLWKRMAATQVICLDSSTTLYLEPWHSLAEGDDCIIHQLQVHAFDKVSAIHEHNLQMQSYFHLKGSAAGRPIWDTTPVLAGTRQTATLSYGGDHAIISAIIALGGHVALEDTYEALSGSLVALVAVQTGLDLRSISNGLSNGQVRRTQEDLPRWQDQTGLASCLPFSAKESFCLGLALVQDVDITNRNIIFTTGLGLHVPQIQRQNYQVAVVVPKATTDGRFRTEWVDMEMHMKQGQSG